jgi:hypothetical protein
MDDQSLQGLFSQFTPDLSDKSSGTAGESAGEADRVLVESVKAFAGQSGGPLEGALEEFLGGKGALLEAAQAAGTRRGSAVDEVVAVLAKQFKLSPAVAALLAGLLVKLLPFAGKETAKEPAAKKKPKAKRKRPPPQGRSPAARKSRRRKPPQQSRRQKRSRRQKQ